MYSLSKHFYLENKSKRQSQAIKYILKTMFLHLLFKNALKSVNRRLHTLTSSWLQVLWKVLGRCWPLEWKRNVECEMKSWDETKKPCSQSHDHKSKCVNFSPLSLQSFLILIWSLSLVTIFTHCCNHGCWTLQITGLINISTIFFHLFKSVSVVFSLTHTNHIQLYYKHQLHESTDSRQL